MSPSPYQNRDFYARLDLLKARMGRLGFSRVSTDAMMPVYLTGQAGLTGGHWRLSQNKCQGVLGDRVGREFADLLRGSRWLGLGRRLLRFLR